MCIGCTTSSCTHIFKQFAHDLKGEEGAGGSGKASKQAGHEAAPEPLYSLVAHHLFKAMERVPVDAPIKVLRLQQRLGAVERVACRPIGQTSTTTGEHKLVTKT